MKTSAQKALDPGGLCRGPNGFGRGFSGNRHSCGLIPELCRFRSLLLSLFVFWGRRRPLTKNIWMGGVEMFHICPVAQERRKGGPAFFSNGGKHGKLFESPFCDGLLSLCITVSSLCSAPMYIYIYRIHCQFVTLVLKTGLKYHLAGSLELPKPTSGKLTYQKVILFPGSRSLVTPYRVLQLASFCCFLLGYRHSSAEAQSKPR